MSWNFSRQGTHTEIREALDADEHCPTSIAEATMSALAEFDERREATVVTRGHINDTGTAGEVLISVTVE